MKRDEQPQTQDTALIKRSGSHKRFKWTDEYLALLGTDSDAKLAKRLNTTKAVVMTKRQKLGITSFNKPNPFKPQHEWTDEQLALLGTIPDYKLGSMIGLSKVSVRNKRHSLGIAALTPPKYTHKANPVHVWSQEHIALLGKMHDKELARIMGVNKSVVLAKRSSLGIQPIKPIAKRLKWTKAMEAALGTISDTNLAKQIGTSQAIVTKKRVSLGIPAFDERLVQRDRIYPELKAICQARGGVLLEEPSSYKDRNTKLMVRCEKGHVFRSSGVKLKAGLWCGTCRYDKTRVYTIGNLIRFAEERGIKCLSTHYTSSNSFYDWECQNGHRWSYSWTNITKLKYILCPECRAKSIKHQNERQANAQATRYKPPKALKLARTKTSQ